MTPLTRRCVAAFALASTHFACSGDDVLPIDADFANQVAAAYGGSSGLGGSGAGGAAQTANAPRPASTSTGVDPAAGAASAPAESASPSQDSAGAGGSSGASSAAAGSGGGSASNPPPAASPCDGFAILSANCSSSGCHGAGSNLGTFAASEAAARSYIGKAGTVACAGVGVVIDLEDPPASLLIQKLGDEPPCGNYMPIAATRLPKADIDCIEDWIGSLK
jgi:hypothetical protein